MKRTLTIILGLLVVLTAVLFVGGLVLRSTLKKNIIATLQRRFEADVQIQDLDVVVFPHILAVFHGVVLRTKEHPDPPLITIEKLTLSASLLNLLRRHVSGVYLQGLQIRVPPHPPESGPSPAPKHKKVHFPLVIDEIVSDDALLETLPSDAKHVARDFSIHHVVLHSFSFENPAPFRATLTNPQPFGEIETEGQFGPWNAEVPGDTPVSGTFSYSHADFNSIKGLSGIMSSQGSYTGILDRLDVQGDTEMPDFSLDIADNAMPLNTHYVAVVDGTNGNTYLTSVDASLGKSPIHVSGEIVAMPGVRGREITLDATSRSARAEDLIHLAVRGPSPVRGAMNLHTKIYLPPIGAAKSRKEAKSAADRLSLNGNFDIADARFTNPSLQGRVDGLSRAGQGQPKNTDIKGVPFHLSGKFVVKDGLANMSQTTFEMQGSAVQVDGSYRLDDGALDFRGHLLLDAKISHATTGIKSILLKPFDPLFAKKGKGAVIPFKVGGTRSHPSIRP